jgi:hypothetical protein
VDESEERYQRQARRRLLAALADGKWHSGEELWKRTGVRARLRWQILGELERDGAVESRWDTRREPWPRMYRMVKGHTDF